MKEVGETTRPFRYDLNQIPSDYTVERSIQGTRSDRVLEELWMEVRYVVQEAVIKTIPKKKKCKKAKWLSKVALQIAEGKKKKTLQKAKEKRKDIPILMQSSKEEQGEIGKPSSAINEKKQKKTIEWERLEISSRKLEIAREHLLQRWAQ